MYEFFQCKHDRKDQICFQILNKKRICFFLVSVLTHVTCFVFTRATFLRQFVVPDVENHVKSSVEMYRNVRNLLSCVCWTDYVSSLKINTAIGRLMDQSLYLFKWDISRCLLLNISNIQKKSEYQHFYALLAHIGSMDS